MSVHEQEGFISVDGYRVWYRSVGGGSDHESIALLILHDESMLIINEVLQKGIAGSEWVLLENCSHISHIEAPELYMQTVSNFLNSVERNPYTP